MKTIPPEPVRCIECRHECNPTALHCGLCPECTADPIIRQKHNLIEQELNTMKPNSAIAPYPCPEHGCTRDFATAQGLLVHRARAHGTPGTNAAKNKTHRCPPAAPQPPAEPPRGTQPQDTAGFGLPPASTSSTLSTTSTPLTASQAAIAAKCEQIKAILLAKNAAYGNSALDPLRIFSRADRREQIRVRIDDKLSRLQRGQSAGEDVVIDLVGYLILDLVAADEETAKEKKP